MNSPEITLFNGGAMNFDGLLRGAAQPPLTGEEEAEAAAEDERRKRQLETEMMDAFADLSQDGDEYGENELSADPSFHPDQMPSSTPYIAPSAAFNEHQTLYEELAGSYHFDDGAGSDALLEPEDTLKGATDLGETPARYKTAAPSVTSGDYHRQQQHQQQHAQFTDTVSGRRLPPLAEELELSYSSLQQHAPQSRAATDRNGNDARQRATGDEMDQVPVRGSPRDLVQSDSRAAGPAQTVATSAGHCSAEQLAIISEARAREIGQLRDELRQLREESSARLRQAEHRATMEAAERQVLASCQQQSKQLLAQRDTALAAVRGELESVRVQLKVSEETRDQLLTQLSAAETTVASLQQQLGELQRAECVARNADMHRQIIDTQKRQHEQELAGKQVQLDEALAQLHEQRDSVKRLSTQLSETVDAKQRAVADKSAIIAQLSASLEMSQRQCHQLLAADAGRLRVQLDEEHRQRLAGERQLAEMQTELDGCRRDLQTCESILGLQTDNLLVDGGKELGHRAHDLEDSVQMASRDDLVRAMANLRRHRDEATHLRRQLEQKEQQLRDAQMVITEKDFAAVIKEQSSSKSETAVQTDLVYEDVDSLRTHLNEAQATSETLQTQLDCLQKERDELSASVRDLNNRLTEQILESDRARVEAVEDVRQSCLRLHDDVVNRLRSEKIDDYELKLAALKATVEKLESDLDQVKILYIGVCQEKTAISEKILSLQGSNERDKKEAINKALDQQRKTLMEEMKKSHSSCGQSVEIQTDLKDFADTETQTDSDNENELNNLRERLKQYSSENKLLESRIKSLVNNSDVNKAAGVSDSVGPRLTSPDQELLLNLKSRLEETSKRLCSAYEEFDREKQELVAVYEEKIRLVLDQNCNTLVSQRKINQLTVECDRLRAELEKQEHCHRETTKQREEMYNRTLNSYYTLMRNKAQELKAMENDLRSKIYTSDRQTISGRDSKWLIDENQRLSSICGNVVDAIQRESEKCQRNLVALELNENSNTKLRSSLAECKAQCQHYASLAERSAQEVTQVRSRFSVARDKMRLYHENVKRREQCFRTELLRLETAYRDAVNALKEHMSVCSGRSPGEEVSRGVQTDVTGESLFKTAREMSEYQKTLMNMKAAMKETLDEFNAANRRVLSSRRVSPERPLSSMVGRGSNAYQRPNSAAPSQSSSTALLNVHSSRGAENDAVGSGCSGISSAGVESCLPPDANVKRSHVVDCRRVAAEMPVPDSARSSRSMADMAAPNSNMFSNRILEDPLVSMERIRKDIEYIFASGARHFNVGDGVGWEEVCDAVKSTTPPSKDTQSHS